MVGIKLALTPLLKNMKKHSLFLASILCLPVMSLAQGSLNLSAFGATSLQHTSIVYNYGASIAYQFADINPIVGYGGSGQFPSSINLNGINSISVTWSAPAGYMYVVTPPPAANGAFSLQFGLAFGDAGEADSLGQLTESSALFMLVYGSAPANVVGGASLQPGAASTGLLFSGGVNIIDSNTVGFAFTSFSIMTQFNGSSPSGVLATRQPFYSSSPFNIMLAGGVHDLFGPYSGAPDPGSLLTLQPLPTPEPTTMSLLGLAAAAYLFSRKTRR